jgi:hypothetical protein
MPKWSIKKMPRFDKDEIKRICEEMNVLMDEVEKLDAEIPKSSGEVKSAYLLVHKEYLWKIQRKMGEMWFILGNADAPNPFDMDEEVKQSES